MIAALFVEKNGVYSGIPTIDVWDIERDARTYAGPYPVVAHPPCQRWGRYWSGGPSARVRRIKGDDDGCFASALASVKRWGGVLEHPEASHAWSHFGIRRPPKNGGWIATNDGYTCCVEQGHYGHPARKATWLFFVGQSKPRDLIWGPCLDRARLDEGFHSREERAAARAAGKRPVKRLSTAQNIATPPLFAQALVLIARNS